MIKLAEEVIDSPSQSSDTERVYRKQIETWERRQAGIAETNPLYQAAEAEIAKYQDLVREESGGHDPERKLLERVTEGFVIQRQRLDPDTDLEPSTLFEVSQAVRERAAEELDR